MISTVEASTRWSCWIRPHASPDKSTKAGRKRSAETDAMFDRPVNEGVIAGKLQAEHVLDLSQLLLYRGVNPPHGVNGLAAIFGRTFMKDLPLVGIFSANEP